MKKYISYLGLGMFFLSLGFFCNVEFAKADCCVTPAIPPLTTESFCEAPDADGNCPSGIPSIPGGTCAQMDAQHNLCDNIDSSPPPTSSTTPTASSSTIIFTNPIGFETVSELVASILNNLMGVLAFIAAIFIVIGGIMYMTSGGDENMIGKAKKTLTGAMAGLAIALATPTFLKTIQEILGGNSSVGANADDWVSDSLTLTQIATNVLNFLLSVVGILAIIALVIGGGMYLTAYGDEKKVDDGKKIIKYAIIGIAVALSALIIIRQIDAFLNAAA